MSSCLPLTRLLRILHLPLMYERSKYHVAVTGSNGQLGNELARIAADHPRFRFTFLSREIFPMEDPEKMEVWLDQHPIDIFIHCAAYTAVDKAESEKEKAFEVNAKAPGIIASLLAKKKSQLIYISTDYVFDGTSSSPLTEDAPTNPVNTYGASKLEGERQVLHNNPATQVIRTSWLYSAYGNNFVKTMIRLMKERESIRVVQDQKGSPTYAGDLAKAILQMLESDHFIRGIYHYSNEGETTWFEFAQEIKKLTGSTCTIHPIPSSGFPTPAKRPAYSLMDKSKIRKDFGLLIPDWRTSLAICIDILKKQEV
jgi:dTDP-4-dehydrorhamnose reductase